MYCRSCYRRDNNRSLKCLGLTILGANTTFFDNVTLLLAIRTKLLRASDSNMSIFLAAKTLQVFRMHRWSASLGSISYSFRLGTAMRLL